MVWGLKYAVALVSTVWLVRLWLVTISIWILFLLYFKSTHLGHRSLFAGRLVIETEAFDYLDAPVARVTGADVPMPYAINLEQAAIPQVDNIYTAAKRTVERVF